MGDLTQEFVDNVKKPGRYGDGNGLFLKVRKSGSKQWVWRGTIRGRKIRREQGFGGHRDISMAEARRKAIEHRELAQTGKDPKEHQPDIPTFAAAMVQVISKRRAKWRDESKTEDEWRRSLDYAMPTLGAQRIHEITAIDVMGVLLPIWATKTETARRVLQRIGAIMKWAVAEGYREDNVVNVIRPVLPKHAGSYRRERARRPVDEDYLARLLQRATRSTNNRAEEEQQLLDFMEWSIAKGPFESEESLAKAEAKRIADSMDSHLWIQVIFQSETSPRAWATLQGVVEYLWERKSPFLHFAPRPPYFFSPLWIWIVEVAMGIRKEPPPNSSSGPKADEKLWRDVVIAGIVGLLADGADGHRPIFPSNKNRRSVCKLVADRLREIGETVREENTVREIWTEQRREK